MQESWDKEMLNHSILFSELWYGDTRELMRWKNSELFAKQWIETDRMMQLFYTYLFLSNTSDKSTL